MILDDALVWFLVIVAISVVVAFGVALVGAGFVVGRRK